MTRTLGRNRLLLGAGLGALLVAGSVIFLVGRTPRSSPLPNPNGYDDLVKAAQMAFRAVDNPADLDSTRLRALVATNAEPLRLLRLGLTRPCAVPTERTATNLSGHVQDLIGLKSLAMALFAEGRLAEIENRPVDAARSYVDSLRLGTEISRGGFMMTRLVGIACEGLGGIPLEKLIPKLRCEQILPLVAKLAQIDGNTVTWEEVMKNEDLFAYAEMRKDRFSFLNPIRLVALQWRARTMSRRSEKRHDLATAHVRLMMTELALRQYRCDQGTAPQSLQQLVPKYLQQIPKDPFSGHSLVYRSKGTNWLVYSLGPDRMDDGGKPAGQIMTGDRAIGIPRNELIQNENPGDLLYDSPW